MYELATHEYERSFCADKRMPFRASNMPAAILLRYEKMVVEWVQDSLVKKCPDCGEGFGFTRRRHHCRLCGGVVCAPCSETIDVPEVRAFPLPMFPMKPVTTRKVSRYPSITDRLTF